MATTDRSDYWVTKEGDWIFEAITPEAARKAKRGYANLMRKQNLPVKKREKRRRWFKMKPSFRKPRKLRR